MALFNFALNGTSVFMFVYFILLCIVFVYKKVIFAKMESIVLITTAILAVVYLTRDISFLFFQLNVWIMPFLALASLRKNIYSIFLVVPVIGYIKRTLVDGDTFTGALATLFGASLANIPTYESLIRPFMDPLIIHYAFNSLMSVLYIVLLIVLFADLLNFDTSQKIKNILPSLKEITLAKMTMGLVIFFVLFLLTDFTIKSRYILLPTKELQEISLEIPLKQAPIEVIIDNPNEIGINALQVMIKRKSITSDDKVVFDFYDMQNNSLLLKQSINDYYFPQSDDKSYIFLNKSISSKKIRMLVYKKDGKNDLVTRQVKIIQDVKLNEAGHLAGFTSPEDKEEIFVSFRMNENMYVKLRGSYPIKNMLSSLKQNIDQNTSFFAIYLGAVSLSLLGILVLSRNLYLKRTSKE